MSVSEPFFNQGSSRGEAGIGKTALLREFCARQRDMRVLWGGCDDLFTPRPLAPLYDIARQCPGGLLEAVGSGAGRESIFTAALDELEQTPTLVVFEDMHWADEATLDLLKFLGRRIQRTRSILAASYRDDEVGPGHPRRSSLVTCLGRTCTGCYSRRFPSQRSLSSRAAPAGVSRASMALPGATRCS